MITPLALIAAGIAPANAAAWAAPLLEACAAYGIVTPARVAAFVAQVGHESGGLRYVREVWGPTPAQSRYEGRADLGNTRPGDGQRYCGRGLLQTTGRDNYRRLRDRLRARIDDVPDFEAGPDQLEQPRWAALSAADYWDMCGLNALADAGDFERITRRINGGLNGQADRLARWARAKLAFSDPAANPQPQPAPATADAYTQEGNMPLPLFLAAALPSIIEAIPKLGKLFGSGSEVAERNVKAAEMAVGIAAQAIGAHNAQDAVERMRADPAVAKAAAQAIEARWFELAEAGGGGIDGARKADAAARASGDPIWHSPSFWAALGMLPLAYIVVVGVIFNLGGGWSADVRAAVATTVISLIIGGMAGYYFGSTTSRNRGSTTTEATS